MRLFLSSILVNIFVFVISKLRSSTLPIAIET
jgi:hypothetical protein